MVGLGVLFRANADDDVGPAPVLGEALPQSGWMRSKTSGFDWSYKCSPHKLMEFKWDSSGIRVGFEQSP
jgi:hypothetical protein